MGTSVEPGPPIIESKRISAANCMMNTLVGRTGWLVVTNKMSAHQLAAAMV